MEVWKDVTGYEGFYQVSNLGNVKNRNKKLKPNISNVGYKYVILSKNKNPKTCTIHRLVATAFIKNPNKKRCVNHKDGNKLNNHKDNLEWCTYTENRVHALNNKFGNNYSETHWNSKLSKKDVLDIKLKILEKKLTQKEIAKIYNVNQSTISDIKNKKIRNKYE